MPSETLNGFMDMFRTLQNTNLDASKQKLHKNINKDTRTRDSKGPNTLKQI